MWIFIVIEICFIIFSIYHYKKIKKENAKLSKKSKFILGFAIFCTAGSFALISDSLECSIGYAIVASILYIFFILSSRHKDTSTMAKKMLINKSLTNKTINYERKGFDFNYISHQYNINSLQPIFISGQYRILMDCIELINRTANPETFFYRFNMAIDILNVLIPVEDKIKFAKDKPSDVKKVLYENETIIVNNFLERYYKNHQKLTAQNFIDTLENYKQYLSKDSLNKCYELCISVENQMDNFQDLVTQQYQILDTLDTETCKNCENENEKFRDTCGTFNNEYLNTLLDDGMTVKEHMQLAYQNIQKSNIKAPHTTNNRTQSKLNTRKLNIISNRKYDNTINSYYNSIVKYMSSTTSPESPNIRDMNTMEEIFIKEFLYQVQFVRKKYSISLRRYSDGHLMVEYNLCPIGRVYLKNPNNIWMQVYRGSQTSHLGNLSFDDALQNIHYLISYVKNHLKEPRL